MKPYPDVYNGRQAKYLYAVPANSQIR